ncbi:hypothetical protein DTO013E5_3662 [Penicillium roqueforti]|uniref:Uncharacterized protein n=1 Tax=Penicillium roqueforti (strain FM164) TaxID=1365484 RepID=W6Q5Z1_PENRF|nr:uncharacterized protein LCP9604111_382 [Penicillium roqueforti]CDM32118.1 hypothetical protein PROQFM164_S02g002269 [Penicillium roqueforti FM164]KAF9252856.1 hypothetical protein LCP9604111_382 [Penicillium roqueforti]KAI1830642.1 hypothetical protein CBS147337_8490 [Penicillium roqueforti]KAI2676047.1 hypothetical protein CBS147355_6228 [Penicillium roqueforti]KAI2679266.1 hypothetical protein LCP963914a_7365 [Penicillium roqueforti]
MAFVADQFFSEMDATISNEWVDFDQFLDLPSAYDDQSTATTVSPQDLALPYEADGIFTPPSDFMQSSFDMTNCGFPQEEFMGMDGGFMQDPAVPLFDDASFLAYNPYDSSNTFRNLVEAQAAADPRVGSIKEKRREAGIALHLQRLCDDTALDLDMSSDSNTSFSSPSWSEYVRGSISPRPSPETTSVSEAPPPGGMEMILDLNMNAAANVPRKQKPRSQAQKENYIKARKYGACEKHKKQHKRCNCLEKAAARASDVPMNAALQPRPRQTTPQVPTSESRYSDSPGHHSFNPAQALPTIKAIRKPTGCTYGVDPSMGLPVAVPTTKQNIRTKTQKSTPPGHDIVLLSGKLNSNSNCTLNQDNVLSSSRNAAKGHCAGHDILLSGKNIPNNSCAGHERLVTQEKISKSTASGQPHNTCSSNSPRPAHAAGVSSGSSSLRWCVSTSPVGVAWSERTVKTSSANHSTACDGRTPGLDVQRTRSTPTMARSMVPGTVAGSLGMRHSTLLRNSGTQLPGSDHRASEGLAWQISKMSGLLPVPNDLPVSPSRRGSSGLSGTGRPLISGDSLRVRSAAERTRRLLTSTALAFSGAWQSSLSLASGVEGVVYKALSLFARHVVSAKKGLYLGGLRNAFV